MPADSEKIDAKGNYSVSQFNSTAGWVGGLQEGRDIVGGC